MHGSIHVQSFSLLSPHNLFVLSHAPLPFAVYDNIGHVGLACLERGKRVLRVPTVRLNFDFEA